MKILVTGGRGQLGQAIQSCLNQHTLSICDLPEMDIANPEVVVSTLESIKPDLVLNAAAYTDVDGAESHPEDAYRVNVDGPRVLAEKTSQRQIPLLHMSTDYVFDGTKSEPYNEHDEPNPQSVYGRTKWEGEKQVRQINPHHYIVRTAWLYSAVGKNFAKTIISLAKNPEVRVVNDQIGSPTYAPHLAVALGKLVKNYPFGTYHIAGGGQTSWCGLTCELFKRLEIRTPVKPIVTKDFPRPAKRPAFSVLTSIHEPTVTLPDWELGVNDFVKIYRQKIT